MDAVIITAFAIVGALWLLSLDRRIYRVQKRLERQKERADRAAALMPIIAQEAFNEGVDMMDKAARMGDWDTTNLQLWKKSDAKRNVERETK